MSERVKDAIACILYFIIWHVVTYGYRVIHHPLTWLLVLLAVFGTGIWLGYNGALT